MDPRQGAKKKTKSSRVNDPPPARPNLLLISTDMYSAMRATLAAQTEPVWKSLAEQGCALDSGENWDGMEFNQKPNVYERITDFIRKKMFTDFKVRIGEHVFDCHLMLLQAMSDYFEECLVEEEGTELPADEVSPASFQLIYDWMLVEDPYVQTQHLLIMYKGAQYLRIGILCDQIWKHLDNPNMFNEDRAWNAYLSACLHQLPSVQLLMLRHIKKFFLTLVATDEFLKLQLQELTILLTRCNIAVNSEIEIFFAVVRWINADLKMRLEHLVVAMKCVRFGLMPASYILSLTAPEDVDIKHVVCNNEVKKMIREGLEVNSIHVYFSDNKADVGGLLDRLDMKLPKPRCWVYDQANTHHHTFKCHQHREATYKDFLDYLQYLHSNPNAWRRLRLVDDWDDIECCEPMSNNRSNIACRHSLDRGLLGSPR